MMKMQPGEVVEPKMAMITEADPKQPMATLRSKMTVMMRTRAFVEYGS